MSEDIGKPGQVKAFLIYGPVKWIDPPDNDFDRLLVRYQEEYEKHRWIPCAERMPEEGQKVLLWFTNVSGGFCDLGKYMGGAFETEDFERVSVHAYSHWMPLPEGPEVKG